MNTRDRGYSPHTSNGSGSSASTSQQQQQSQMASISSSGNLVKTASLNEIWQDLKLGIESVYSQQTMSKPRYMTLYSLV